MNKTTKQLVARIAELEAELHAATQRLHRATHPEHYCVGCDGRMPPEAQKYEYCAACEEDALTQ